MHHDQPTDDRLDRLEQAILERCARAGSLAGASLVVAIDGRSGSGKSTLAERLARRLSDVTLIDGDGFYAGGDADQWERMTVAERVGHCIDWRRLREVIAHLRAGRSASWYDFDWVAFDGRLMPSPTVAAPAEVVIIDGVYSGRPELADLVDLRVFVDTDPTTREAWLSEREGPDRDHDWERRWTSAEDHYFDQVAPPSSFDLVL